MPMSSRNQTAQQSQEPQTARIEDHEAEKHFYQSGEFSAEVKRSEERAQGSPAFYERLEIA